MFVCAVAFKKVTRGQNRAPPSPLCWFGLCGTCFGQYEQGGVRCLRCWIAVCCDKAIAYMIFCGREKYKQTRYENNKRLILCVLACTSLPTSRGVIKTSCSSSLYMCANRCAVLSPLSPLGIMSIAYVIQHLLPLPKKVTREQKATIERVVCLRCCI